LLGLILCLISWEFCKLILAKKIIFVNLINIYIYSKIWLVLEEKIKKRKKEAIIMISFMRVDIISSEAADQLTEQILLCSPPSTAIMILTLFNLSNIHPATYREKFSDVENKSAVSTQKFFRAYNKALSAMLFGKSTKHLLEDSCFIALNDKLHITPGGILIPPKDITHFDWERNCNHSFPYYSGAVGVCHDDGIQDHEIAMEGLKKWAEKVFKKR
jgi:hypothetical protein